MEAQVNDLQQGNLSRIAELEQENSRLKDSVARLEIVEGQVTALQGNAAKVRLLEQENLTLKDQLSALEQTNQIFRSELTMFEGIIAEKDQGTEVVEALRKETEELRTQTEQWKSYADGLQAHLQEMERDLVLSRGTTDDREKELHEAIAKIQLADAAKDEVTEK
ncbi:hypothetical protein HDU93_006440 [Gonapodya sp. JEL0774]|nr:hypothetical protein HDU93_006440 [Gonapodya sp. JEL0774]